MTDKHQINRERHMQGIRSFFDRLEEPSRRRKRKLNKTKYSFGNKKFPYGDQNK
jgi:hypothetical protein